MNKPVAIDTARIEPAAPVVLVPKPPAATPASPRFRKTWLIAGLLSLAVLAVIGVAWWLATAEAPVNYTTAPVSRGAVTRAVTATGTVNPVLTIIVGAYDSGVIQDLQCDYNTQVKKGQICAKIDTRPYQTVVDQNKANLAVAKAQLETDKANLAYTKLGLDRAAKLVQTNAVSQDTYDSAKSNYDQALATIAFDEATIRSEEHTSELQSLRHLVCR